MTAIALATIYHDPHGRLCEQAQRVLPLLTRLFSGIAINATPETDPRLLQIFARDALIRRDTPGDEPQRPRIGLARKEAVELALQLDCSAVLYCDGDRILHWAEYHPDELKHIIPQLGECDFTVLGRTRRAFDTHPATMRETESIINRVFGLVSGNFWDITSGARGLSRPAVQAVIANCHDEDIRTDASWPLFLQRQGNYSMQYITADGLEYETTDKFCAEVAEAGGSEAWLARLEHDPQQWSARLDMARAELDAILAYLPGQEQ